MLSRSVNTGIETLGRKIDTAKAAADFDRSEAEEKRFQEWCAQVDPLGRRYLTEAPLSRVWRHLEDPSTAVGIISASRGENPAPLNAEKTRALAADVRNAGFGFFYVDGKWLENFGRPDQREVSETSLFIIGTAAQSDVLAARLEEWRVAYEQQAFLFKAAGTDEVLEVSDSGAKSLGDWHPNKVGQAMTQLRGRAGSFVFAESCTAYEHKGFFGLMGVNTEWKRRFRAAEKA